MGLIKGLVVVNGQSLHFATCVSIIAIAAVLLSGFPPSTSQGTSTSSQGAVLNYRTKHFIIASILDDPYLMYKRSPVPLVGNDAFEGFAKDLADMLATRLNFTYQFDITSTSRYGHRFRNGSWNGIIELLMRPPTDEGEKITPQIAIAAMTITEARAKVVSFSSPFMEFQFALLMKKPPADIDTDSEVGGYKHPHVVYKLGDGVVDDEEGLDAEDSSGEDVGYYIFLRPMTPVLWGIFLGSVILTVLLIFTVEKVISQKWSQAQEEVINRERAPDSKVTILPKPVGLCANGIIGSPRTTAGRFLQIIFWVYIAIFVGAYIATFSADRIVDELNDDDEPPFDPETLQPLVNTIEELTAQTKIKFAALRGGSTHDYFLHTSNPLLRKANSMMHADDVIIRTTAQGVQRVRESNATDQFVFIMEEPTARAIAGLRPCDLIVSTEVFGPKRGYGIAMSQSLHEGLVRQINLEILDMKEKEELERLERKWFHDRSNCLRRPRRKQMTVANIDENSEDGNAAASEDVIEQRRIVNDGGDDEIEDDDADHALCIKEMAGAFYILAAALIIALFVAVIEICCASRNAIVTDRDEDKEIELQPHQRQPQQQR